MQIILVGRSTFQDFLLRTHSSLACGLLTVFGVAIPVAAGAGPALLHGLRADGAFGLAVADAGDVDGDGLDDLIVGAPHDDFTGIDAGRAFLWRGGSPLTAAPTLTFFNGAPGDQLGASVSGVGDVNDDGYDDVAVAAPYQDSGGTDAGAVYVYFGGRPMDPFADLVLWGEGAGDGFGWSVHGIGDVSGDGIDDWMVGAPFADPPAGGADAGAIYLYTGEASLPTRPAHVVRYDGEAAASLFGWDLGTVVGFRSPGRLGVLVGAPGYGANAGRAYLLEAPDGMTIPSTVPTVIFEGASPGAELGYAVSGAGRFNGDALEDVVIGLPGVDESRGQAWLFQGQGVSTPVPTYVIEGLNRGDRFGEAVVGAGNHDGSGSDEFVVGAPGYADGAGAATLFQGGSLPHTALDGRPLEVVDTTGISWSQARFGSALGVVGDQDGDGLEDLMVGSPKTSFADGRRGAVLLTSSGGGIVPVLTVRLDMVALEGGRWRLAFTGPAVDAPEVWLWTFGPRAREIVALGRGLEREHETLVAVIGPDELRDASSVVLRWRIDGMERSQSFALIAVSPDGPEILPPMPNPFNPSTRLRFELPRATSYSLRILDSRGRTVRRFPRSFAGPGRVEIDFDGRDDLGVPLANGVYRQVLEVEGAIRCKSAVLLR